jgi:hypothetical protein
MTSPDVTPEMIRAVAAALPDGATANWASLTDWADRLEDEDTTAEADARTWYAAYRDAYTAATPPRMWAHPDGRLCVFAPNWGTDHQYVTGAFNQWGDFIQHATLPARPAGFVPVVRPDGVL